MTGTLALSRFIRVHDEAGVNSLREISSKKNQLRKKGWFEHEAESLCERLFRTASVDRC